MAALILQQFFDLEMCARVRAAMDVGRSDDAEVLAGGATVDAAVRRTSSIDVDAETLTLVERALDAARPSIAAWAGVTLARREGAGFLRYPPGGFYRAHCDRAEIEDWPDAARRRMTIVVFLNDDFTGGALRLLLDAEPPRDITPRAGMLVAFDAATDHEVLPVFAGTRDAVVDWFLDS